MATEHADTGSDTDGSGLARETIRDNRSEPGRGLIFFWVDKFIFTSRRFEAQWQVREKVVCCDCHKVARGYRLVRTRNYDKSDAVPQFRCEACSQKKTEQLIEAGVVV